MSEPLRLTIGAKIVLGSTLVAAIAIAVTGFVSYSLAKSSLEDDAFSQLTAVREMKASQIEDYFQLITDQVVTMSEDRMIVDAMREFESSFASLGRELDIDDAALEDRSGRLSQYYRSEFVPRLVSNLLRDVPVDFYVPKDPGAQLLQSLYIGDNPYALGSKYLLDDAADGSRYSATHATYHPIIRDFLETFGYYDIFLVDVNSGGHIVYTVFKEVDFGTSLLSGPYADTAFAEVYRAAAEADEPSYTKLVDFEPYHPSYNAPAAFIASPIFDGDTKLGVLVFQMPIDRINGIMTNGERWSEMGLGESGETYLVGEDLRLRNQSRFLIEDSENYFKMIEDIGLPNSTIARIRNYGSTIGLQSVDTPGTRAALGGESGRRIFPDYRGVSVLSAFKPLQIPDLKWVIMSEIDEAEAFAPITRLARGVGLATLGLAVLVSVIALALSRTITRPVGRLSENAAELALGNLDVAIDTGGADEIGDLARSFSTMRDALKGVIGELEVLNEDLEQRVVDRTAELEASERRTQAIVQSAGDAIIVANGDREIIVWNQAAESTFGYTAAEAEGLRVDALVPDEYQEGHLAGMRQALTAGALGHPDSVHDLMGRRSDGSIFPLEMTLSLWDVGGKAFVSAIIRDVTERKALEHRVALASKRMSDELAFARDIQMSMLPLIFPAFPNRNEVDLRAVLQPAREVGGDFYDFYFLDRHRLCIVIADVSGKGAPGALFMAVSKTLVKSRAQSETSPARILSLVNDEISQDNPSAMFVTMFIAIFDTRSGELVYSNAGHNPPYIRQADGTIETLDARHGPIIGAVTDIDYGESRLTMSPHDIAFLFTDGVTEAMNGEGKFYTEARLEALLEKPGRQSADALVRDCVSSVLAFQGDAEQFDDITVLAMEFIRKKKDLEVHRLVLSLGNQLEEIDQVNARYNAFADAHGIRRPVSRKMNLAFDELLNNIISYAYPSASTFEIEIEIELQPDRLTVCITDGGMPFDPLAVPEVDATAPIEEREIGGLGIHLVRNLMDEVRYERRDGSKNVITLIKWLAEGDIE